MIKNSSQKLKGFFVTGTDTGVGKTVISAVLARSLRQSMEVCYWKPIQTGIEEDDDTKTVEKLAELSDDEIFDRGFRLEKPLSPHLSARLAGVEVTVDSTLDFLGAANPDRFYIVEGAGGVLVPLNENELMINLMKVLELPVIIVARSGLGTINHTCLTLEMLRNKGLQVLGVIMNGEPNLENKKAIEHYGKVRVLAEIPKIDDLETNFRHLPNLESDTWGLL